MGFFILILEMFVLLQYLEIFLCGCWLYIKSIEPGIVFLVDSVPICSYNRALMQDNLVYVPATAL
jgi:hypothetical protein